MVSGCVPRTCQHLSQSSHHYKVSEVALHSAVCLWMPEGMSDRLSTKYNDITSSSDQKLIHAVSLINERYHELGVRSYVADIKLGISLPFCVQYSESIPQPQAFVFLFRSSWLQLYNGTMVRNSFRGYWKMPNLQKCYTS